MFNTVGYLQFASGLLLLFEAFKPSELRRSIYGQFRIGGNLNGGGHNGQEWVGKCLGPKHLCPRPEGGQV